MKGFARLSVICAVLALAYFAAAKLGLSVALLNASASVVWPPTGISIAAVLIFGPRVWPGIFLGALVANATTAGNLATSLAIASGNTIEGLVGGLLVARFARGRQALDRAGDVFRLALFAGIVSPVASATIGVTSLAVARFVPWSGYGSVWLTWWVGDAVGAWIVTPFVLAWAGGAGLRLNRARALELALIGACLAVVGGLVFFRRAPTGDAPLKFLCLPPLVWTAFRCSRREVTAGVVLVTTLAILGTLQRLGALPTGAKNESLLVLQAFLGVASITSLAICAVVSEYRKTEEDLRERTRALRRSNEDLEQFATVASHDLQEPLRMVSSYVRLLEKRCGGRLGPEAEEYIRHAVAGSERMRDLIDGLLTYGRLDGANEPFARVDCGETLAAVLENSALAMGESGATLEHGPLPAVRGDPAQLVQLFQNLIGNAIKFHRPGAGARIRIEAREQAGEWLFSVSDDGIGMDPRDSERIFLVFQRLHHRDEYPGIGIGLAICKRIVERHGGRIWVEAGPGRGCTFFFTLPLAQATSPDGLG